MSEQDPKEQNIAASGGSEGISPTGLTPAGEGFAGAASRQAIPPIGRGQMGETASLPSKPTPSEPPPEPAIFPNGFWARLDYLLRHPDRVLESIRQDQGLVTIIFICLAVSITMGAIYGIEMGATNFLQGSDMDPLHKVLLILITAVKVPCLFLLTLAIVWPPIYVSNAFMGARNSWRQITAMLLGATAISSTILASMVTVSFFFTLTSREYDFIKLLHVLFFAYAGVVGLIFLQRCIQQLSRTGSIRQLAIIWLLLYIFVGTQLAWVMRPFVGSPEEPFQVFRPRKGNFYESVARSLGEVIDD